MNEFLSMPERARQLLERGVVLRSPATTDVDKTVSAERIARGVVIHAGCRLSGAKTSIGPGCELGAEAPVTIETCQLGRGVSLKGGYFSGATFLDGTSIGSCAHVRAGTLLEEESSGGHSVGLKQTVLFPFVTAGSLVNFCDCLMAGGTDRRNHSEVGSSYVHFNFTPHQDKATPSLIGDVPRGVMLDQPPIFLGGQGGLVGPVRIAFGTVIPAGVICRHDILDENKLFLPGPAAIHEPRLFTQGAYRSIRRIVVNNLVYVGNLWALKFWYQFVRKRFMAADPFAEACYCGALEQLDSMLKERIARLKGLTEKLPGSLELARSQSADPLSENPYSDQQILIDEWPKIEERLKEGPGKDVGAVLRDAFLSEWEELDPGFTYVEAIRALASSARTAGSSWLRAIVDSTTAIWKT